MHIRLAEPADRQAVQRLLDEQNRFHVELLPGFFREHRTDDARIDQVLDDPDAVLLVAEVDTSVVALAEIRCAQTKDLPILVQKRYATIQEMIVEASHRGTGIGAALMASAREWARAQGAVSLRTSVVPGNARARAFYEREGFGEIMVNLEADL